MHPPEEMPLLLPDRKLLLLVVAPAVVTSNKSSWFSAATQQSVSLVWSRTICTTRSLRTMSRRSWTCTRASRMWTSSSSASRSTILPVMSTWVWTERFSTRELIASWSAWPATKSQALIILTSGAMRSQKSSPRSLSCSFWLRAIWLTWSQKKMLSSLILWRRRARPAVSKVPARPHPKSGRTSMCTRPSTRPWSLLTSQRIWVCELDALKRSLTGLKVRPLTKHLSDFTENYWNQEKQAHVMRSFAK